MFVGMDVHRNRTQVCVLDRKGNEVRNRNVTNDRQALRKELAGLRRAARRLRGRLRHRMDRRAAGRPRLRRPTLAHPSGCRATAKEKPKNDRVHARTLANLLRTVIWPRPGWRRRRYVSSACCCVNGRGSCVSAPRPRTGFGRRSPMRACRLRATACGPKRVPPGSTPSYPAHAPLGGDRLPGAH